MTTLAATRNIVTARNIAPMTRAETDRVARNELDRFVALLEQLEGADWEQRTACALWSVRDVVAHQGGHVQAGSGVRGLLVQAKPARPYQKRGMNMLDASNQAQVEMRRDWPTDRLIAEVRDGTAKAIAARGRMGIAGRLVRVPAPDYGLMRVDYLLHVIFPRDMWLHRLDIADATGRPFEVDAAHDGVLVTHVVRDMERNVRKRLPGHAVQLTIEGPAGGAWRLGEGEEIAVQMELPAFMRHSSRRPAPGGERERIEVATSDAELRDRVLQSLVAVY